MTATMRKIFDPVPGATARIFSRWSEEFGSGPLVDDVISLPV
jgi:hypothetical protein